MRCACRDELRQHLAERSIGTIVQWGGTPIHRFRGLGFSQSLPRSDRYLDTSLLLPMNHLLSDQQVDAVVGAVKEFFD